ncbi:MAG: diaminopropionate ammonia-lyase [Christensenellaceae bacterium]|nr:diaminopropionate ammonia-lyase [Christensenellaceae bacterium]
MGKELLSKLGIGLFINDKQAGSIPAYLGREEAAKAHGFHSSMPGYAPTPLLRLKGLAKKLGVAEIFVKDESHRFGLKAFKALGSSYAIAKEVAARLGREGALSWQMLTSKEGRAVLADTVLVTATDGNHGKGVAWAAAQMGCRAVVLMPGGTAESRVQAIRALGAEVSVTGKNYDDTVAMAADLAAKNGWLLMQDTAWPGYEEIPADITAGYTTLCTEALIEMEGQKLTHVFLQAGVGSMAAGVAGCLAGEIPDLRICVTEPLAADCFYRSAIKGEVQTVGGEPQTIMAGLNCGTPSAIAWPVLQALAEGFIKCPDFVSAHGMRQAACPVGDDPAFVCGESGAIGLGLVSLLCSKAACAAQREALGLDEKAVILLFSTEGDTDPENYRRVVEEGTYPLPEDE